MRPGMIVTWRTGGPQMTVEAIEGNTACCRYYDDDGSALHRWMPIAELVPVGYNK